MTNDDKIQSITPQEFLLNAQDPNGALPGLNKHLDRLKDASGADNRGIARVCLFLLQAIANTVPWDEEDGLDATRLDDEARVLIPSWRSCIGALMGMTYSNPNPPDEGPTDPE